MKPFLLGSKQLTIEDVCDVAILSRKVTISPQARKLIQKSNRFLKEKIRSGSTFYGINTGFGFLANVRVETDELEQLQYNLLRSHAVGTGEYMSDEVSRAMLFLRSAALAQGYSGVRAEVVDQLVHLLNKGICPLIPEQGSVGASGDLAPLAHLALVLIGEGRARFRGKEMSGKEALSAAGLKPISLGPKEGLALINGTQFIAAIGCLALTEAEHLCDVADAAGALSVEAMRGTASAFDLLIHAVRPHPGQKHVADRLLRFLSPSGKKSEIARSHTDCTRVQDPYSLRCMPQVHGAVRDALQYVRTVLTREINSVTDNPLLFPDEDKILSGGNFHGEPVAFAMDMLAIATAELGSISEQRMSRLINPATSELPAFLSPKSGLNSGYMIVHVGAASIVSENKTLCHPASVDSIPTNADKEDHVSMGAWGARKAKRVVVNVRRVLAMELMLAAQGIDLLRPLKTSQKLEKLHKKIRSVVPKLEQDRYFEPEIRAVERIIAERQLRAEVAV